MMRRFQDNTPCPFKAEEKHYDTKEEAQAAYEAAMAKAEQED